MTSFSDLLELHQQLDELFLEHQRALMRQDLNRPAVSAAGLCVKSNAHD